MIPGSIDTNAIGGGYVYPISRSLRFNSADSAYLSRTPAAAGDRKTWTWSAWVKRAKIGADSILFTAGTGTSYVDYFVFATDNLSFASYPGSSVTTCVTTNNFRDPAAWYHIVLIHDTTQATGSNRIKIYVNNQQQTLTYTFTPAQNYEGIVNTTNEHDIGRYVGYTTYSDLYIAEINFVDGLALTPSSFGKTNSYTGVWQPKKYTGSYGTTGYYLQLADNSNTTAATLGKDSSGNGLNWTPNNFSVSAGNGNDSVVDTPTNYGTRGNYATLNPYDKSSAVTLANGLLEATGGTQAGGNTFSQTALTFLLPTKGKWWIEMTRDQDGSDGASWGFNITRINRGGNGWPATRGNDGYPGYYSFEYGMYGHYVNNTINWRNNYIVNSTDNSVATGVTMTSTSKIYGFAIDCDNLTMGWYMDGVQQGSNVSFIHPGQDAVIAIYKSDFKITFNAGQRAFASTAPAGFKALQSTNLPLPSILKGSNFMDVNTRTGTGATANISGLSFTPNVVWTKSRSATTNHNIFDSVRGVTKGLVPNDLVDQYTDANALTAFNFGGFSLGSDASNRGVNINTNTYVDWIWKESIQSGLDVVSYFGTGSGTTISHNLGIKPQFIAVKAITNNPDTGWYIYHDSAAATPASGYLRFNSSLGFTTDSTIWNDAEPTTSVFSVGSADGVNKTNINYIAYVFAPVSGFSKFGSYKGNGSTDGTFINLGFRPRFVLLKNVTITASWLMIDTARDTTNPCKASIYTDDTAAEATATNRLDIYSNGFKVRDSNTIINENGDTIVYAAFAENPFKIARAR